MASISPQSLPIVVGYAFMAKKMSSMGKVLNSPSDDPSQDQEQVVFDPFAFDEEGSTAYSVIIHKLSEDIMLQHERAESKLKLDQLRRYLSLHPETVLIDPIESVERVISRSSTCSILSEICAQSCVPFRGPRWFLAETQEHARQQMSNGRFTYPVICKPVAACGTRESHLMAVVVDESGLDLAPLPCVVQEYTNHGALLHKVYVMGDDVMVHHRQSLPDLTRDVITSVLFDSQQAYPKLGDFLSARPFEETSEQGTKPAAVPPEGDTIPIETYVKSADILRAEFGLSLFGFDLIECSDTGDLVVIDVNYFPSYKEVEDLPARLKRFIQRKYENTPR